MLKNKNLPVFGALQGVKVLNCTLSLAGPFACTLFADYGADVTKIENPMMPDVGRTSTGAGQQEQRNMRNLALNVPTPEGREVFAKIIKEVDVFIEASKGGQWAGWGLTDEALWKINPRLIIVHISGYGQTGLPDYVERPSFDGIAQAFSGFMSQNGYADRPPVATMPYVADYCTGFMAFIGACMALYSRETTGVGDSVDVAQYEVMMRNCFTAATYFTEGLPTLRAGSVSPVTACYGIFECKDGDIYTLIAGGGVMKKFLPLIGLEYGSEMFPNGTAYGQIGTPGGDEMQKRFIEFCKSKTVDETMKIMLKASCPIGPINDYEMLLKNPHAQARKVFTEWKNGVGKTIKGVDAMPKFKNYPGRVWRGASYLGQENEEILGELGYTADQIKDLYAKKVIGKNDKIC